MNPKNPLKFITSAVAADGGTIALEVSDKDGASLWITLDRKIGTDTKDRIYVDGNILPYENEVEWKKELNRITKETQFELEGEESMINEFVKVIQGRHGI